MFSGTHRERRQQSNGIRFVNRLDGGQAVGDLKGKHNRLVQPDAARFSQILCNTSIFHSVYHL